MVGVSRPEHINFKVSGTSATYEKARDVDVGAIRDIVKQVDFTGQNWGYKAGLVVLGFNQKYGFAIKNAYKNYLSEITAACEFLYGGKFEDGDLIEPAYGGSIGRAIEPPSKQSFEASAGELVVCNNRCKPKN